ncbi:MAG: hypothetical protein ACKO5K_12565 [Armatimonadota bacterium]
MKRKLHPSVVIGALGVFVALLGWWMVRASGGVGPVERNLSDMPMPKEAGEGMARMRAELDRQRAGR